jgi:hypothetical protein
MLFGIRGDSNPPMLFYKLLTVIGRVSQNRKARILAGVIPFIKMSPKDNGYGE